VGARIVVVLGVFCILNVAGCKSDDKAAPADMAAFDAAQPVDLKLPDLEERTNAGPPDLAGIDLFGYPAPHDPLPLLLPHSGTVLKNVRLVTVTYDDYTNRDSVEAIGDFVFGSQWWKAVSAEYGVVSGVHEGQVHLAGKAPATGTSADLLDALNLRIDAGTAPQPTDDITDQVVYMIFISPTTLLKESFNGTSCQDYFGFHGSKFRNGKRYAYAIVADCGAFDDVTATFGHELVEAATDPYDGAHGGYFIDPQLPDHWFADTYQESADLCEQEDYVYEGSFALQPAWSNAAAAAGLAPCVPNNDWPYYGFDVSPKTAPTVAAGSTVIFTITGWALSPTKNWTVTYAASQYSDLTETEMKPSLSTTHINNGDTLTIKLTVPATATSGKVGAVDVYSTTYTSRLHPVAFVVQ